VTGKGFLMYVDLTRKALDFILFYLIVFIYLKYLPVRQENMVYHKNNFSKLSIISGEGWPVVTSVRQRVETDFIMIIRIYVSLK